MMLDAFAYIGLVSSVYVLGLVALGLVRFSQDLSRDPHNARRIHAPASGCIGLVSSMQVLGLV